MVRSRASEGEQVGPAARDARRAVGRRGAVRVRGALAAALVLLVACAHRGGSTPVPDATASRSAPSIDPSAPKASEPALDVGAWASRFGTPLACEREARRAPPARRFSSIRACVRRDDFTDAAILLRPPWAELLRAEGVEGVDLLARVLARRGFDWAVDIDVATDLGLPVGALEPRVRPPDPGSATRRAWTLVRARVARRRGSALTLVGQTAVLREHKQARIEHTWGPHGYVRAPEVRWGDRALAGFHEWGPSGIELKVTRGGERCAEAEGDAVLALVRLVRLTPVPVEGEAKSVFDGEAELLRCYPASQHG